MPARRIRCASSPLIMTGCSPRWRGRSHGPPTPLTGTFHRPYQRHQPCRPPRRRPRLGRWCFARRRPRGSSPDAEISATRPRRPPSRAGHPRAPATLADGEGFLVPWRPVGRSDPGPATGAQHLQTQAPLPKTARELSARAWRVLFGSLLALGAIAVALTLATLRVQADRAEAERREQHSASVRAELEEVMGGI